MSLPKVTVSLLNGQLGGVEASSDGVAGLVLSGTAVVGKIALNEPKVLFGVKDLESLGITVENNPLVYDEVTAFFAKAGEGAELWISLYSDATNLVTLCDKVTVGNTIKKLLDAATGRIRILGVNRKAPAEYVPVTAQGIDGDVISAIAKLQELADEYAGNYKPFRAILPGLSWTGDVAALINLTQSSANRVSVMLGADKLYAAKGKAAVGMAIGRLASIPVNRNLGRVKDGSMSSEAWFTDGSTSISKEAMWGTLHDNGFIFFRSFQGKNGYYFNFDSTCAPASDDYHQLSLGRTVDKAIALAYTTYVEELLDTVEIDQAGKLAPAVCKYFEGRIENAVNIAMSGQISSFAAYINPQQNILSSGKLTIACTIVPLGTLVEIVVELGFSNPAL
jgi:hypothetical protein